MLISYIDMAVSFFRVTVWDGHLVKDDVLDHYVTYDDVNGARVFSFPLYIENSMLHNVRKFKGLRNVV